MEISDIKDKIENAIIAIATCDKEGVPNNTPVMYAKIKDGKIIITNNYLGKTLNNLLENPLVALTFWEQEKGWKINGTSEYFQSGKYFEFIKSLKENEEHPANGAVVITPTSVKEI